MCTKQEIGAPLDRGPEVAQLTRRRDIAAVLDGAPAQEGDRECHREPEFDVIAGVVVATGQVNLCSLDHQITKNASSCICMHMDACADCLHNHLLLRFSFVDLILSWLELFVNLTHPKMLNT